MHLLSSRKHKTPPGTVSAPAPGKQKAPDSSERRPPKSSNPVWANFDSEHLTLGAGVAIFHIASERVVICYHTRDRYWFLPKGRKDAGEDIRQAAEREGFEESGYRNRLIPLPIHNLQTLAADANPADARAYFCSEPVWTQFAPNSPRSQYILFWYIAETVPPDVEQGIEDAITSTFTPISQQASSSSAGHIGGNSSAEPSAFRDRSASVPTIIPTSPNDYVPPNPYPPTLSIRERLRMEPPGYEPVRHEDTGVDSVEDLYTSELVSIPRAMHLLTGSTMSDVVRRGWDAILLRRQIEDLAGAEQAGRAPGAAASGR